MILSVYRLNTQIRSTMLCLSDFELYSRWVPLLHEGLKGLRHQDIAFQVNQFCAEVITYCLNPYTKYSCRVMKKILNNFITGSLVTIKVLQA